MSKKPSRTIKYFISYKTPTRIFRFAKSANAFGSLRNIFVDSRPDLELLFAWMNVNNPESKTFAAITIPQF